MLRSLIFILISVVISGCSTMATLRDPPKVKFKDVKLKDTDFTNALLDIVLEVDNKNEVAAVVDRLKYSLVVDEKEIAQGIFSEKVELPAQSISQVVVPIKVKVQDLFSSALNMLQKKGAPYKLSGSVGIGIFDIPFDADGKIELKEL
jgi:LEA14-like dessication related protein